MFTIKKYDYADHLVLPPTAAACPSDNDGVHLDSEPHIQACIIQAAAAVCERETLSDEQTALVRATFGQPDNLMSMDLFDKLSADPDLGKSPLLSTHTRVSFVPFFIDARAGVWREWTLSGRVEPKPGALDYLQEFRTSDRLFGLVTGMPFAMVKESVSNVLHADDILPLDRSRRVCCDDERLNGSGKPDLLCYELGVSHFVDTYDIDPRDMWMIEDRANGAVAALRARYHGASEKYRGHEIGTVIVIPDAHDVNPIELWDKKNLMEDHLKQFPHDRRRLIFLRSLEDLSFVR